MKQQTEVLALEPILAEIEHINELGTSKWFEVVYYDSGWQCYAGSKTFKDSEKVIRWKYAKDCLNGVDYTVDISSIPNKQVDESKLGLSDYMKMGFVVMPL